MILFWLHGRWNRLDVFYRIEDECVVGYCGEDYIDQTVKVSMDRVRIA